MNREERLDKGRSGELIKSNVASRPAWLMASGTFTFYRV